MTVTDLRPPIDVTIRPFEPEDLERVRWLFARTPPWGRTYPRPEPFPDDLESIAHRYENGAFVALEQDLAGEAIVGFSAVALVSADERSSLPPFVARRPTMSRIHWVSVAPERWRLGLGRRLTQACIDWSRRNECLSVILQTTPAQAAAIALYESMGFAEVGRSGVEGWTLVWLEMKP